MISRFAKAFIVIIVSLLLLATLGFIHPPSRAYIDPWTGELLSEAALAAQKYTNMREKGSPSPDVVNGGVIMPHLGNATAKAELGRSTWKLLHTMTLRYPEHPTPDQRDALESYFHLLSRLYPCGECAAEFQALLKSYPPQTSTRRAASLWLCSLHNRVNERLKKPEFDCAHLDSTYDCGCGDEPLNNPGDSNNARIPAVSGASAEMVNGG